MLYLCMTHPFADVELELGWILTAGTRTIRPFRYYRLYFQIDGTTICDMVGMCLTVNTKK